MDVRLDSNNDLLLTATTEGDQKTLKRMQMVGPLGSFALLSAQGQLVGHKFIFDVTRLRYSPDERRKPSKRTHR